MRTRSLTWTAITALVIACSTRPRGFVDAGDASTSDTSNCRSHADCDDRTPCTIDRCLVGGVCENTPDHSMCTPPQVCMSGRGCTDPAARTCRSNTDCDDRIDCTQDSCLIEGVCRNAPRDSSCPAGQRCDPMRGCVMQTRCLSSADCNDGVDCTEDTCGVDGRCVHVPQNNRCSTGRVCNVTMGCVVERPCENDAQCSDGMYCNGTERCSAELACVAGTPVDCDDGDPCTRDSCDEGTRSCTHVRDSSCMGTMPRSGFYDISPAVMYTCPNPFGGPPLIDYSFTSLQFSVSSSDLTVTGGPVAMRGPAPAAGNFDVSGTITGSCNEIYRLAGRFTDATHFSATFSMTLMSSFPGACDVCSPPMRSWMITGTAR